MKLSIKISTITLTVIVLCIALYFFNTNKPYVRLVNEGNIQFDSLAISIDQKDYMFAGLKPGTMTKYKKMPYLPDRENLVYTIYFNGTGRQSIPIDPIEKGDIKEGHIDLSIVITKNDSVVILKYKRQKGA